MNSIEKWKAIMQGIMPEDLAFFEALKFEIDQNERKLNRLMWVIIMAVTWNLVGTAYIAYRLYYGLLNAWG